MVKCSPTRTAVLTCSGDKWTESMCNRGNLCEDFNGSVKCIQDYRTSECLPGETKCNEDGLKSLTCNTQGAWETRSCGPNRVCIDNVKGSGFSCIASNNDVRIACTFGERKCTKDKRFVLTCSSKGKWKSKKCKWSKKCHSDGQGTSCTDKPKLVDGNQCHQGSLDVCNQNDDAVVKCDGNMKMYTKCPAGQKCLMSIMGAKCDNSPDDLLQIDPPLLPPPIVTGCKIPEAKCTDNLLGIMTCTEFGNYTTSDCPLNTQCKSNTTTVICN